MRKHSYRLLAGLFCLCIFSNAAFAADGYDTLTEDNVRAFIEKTAAITAGNALEMSPKQIQDYLDEHIEKAARFKSTMKYSIPGYPTQEAAMSLSKEDFITSVEKAAESVSGYENKVKILAINIASNEKNATVQTQALESGTMPMKNEDGNIEEVPIEGISTCDQIITLNKKGVIQMFGAQCVTEISFLPY